ncbi:VWA domain-containing protein [bacterium]|nr:VWA domain-containing protein [bacterium]MCI0603055.1 VWA domain-containing protein [bacterium]
MRKSIIVVSCLATLAFTGMLFSQGVEVFVALVDVWVKAVDESGEPVTDLKAEDFEVYENGKKVNLECFDQRTHDISNEPVSTTDPPKFVVYLDLLNTEGPHLALIRSRLFDFLDQMAPYSYEVMVVALVPDGKLGVVCPYTRNSHQVKAAIEKAKGNGALSSEVKNNEGQILTLLDQLEPEEEDPLISIEDLAETRPNLIREKNTQILTNVYRLAYQFTKLERQRGELTLRALETLGVYLVQNKNEGAHTIVLYISGGFNSEPGKHYYELIDRIAEKKGFVFDRQVFALRVAKQEPEHFDVLELLRGSVGKLTRLNVTLYAVGTRGMPLLADSSIARSADRFGDNLQLESTLQDSLVQLADQTGGLAFTKSQNFKVGFDRITKDLEHNYVLCYSPPDHGKPKYHEIRVVCKRPGVKLRYRKGYFH